MLTKNVYRLRQLNKATIKNKNPLPRIDDLFDQLQGHNVSDEGNAVDTQKIEVVKTWPRPMTPTKFRSFLGFHELKDRLTSAPVLALPEGSEVYAVYCDASGVGLGCILMQYGKGFGERTQDEKRGERAKFVVLEGLGCGFRQGLIPKENLMLFEGINDSKCLRKEPMELRAGKRRRNFRRKGPATSSASAPAPWNKCEYNSQNSQNFRARPAHSQSSKAQRGTKNLICAKCGRSHSRVYRDDSTSCFKCGQNGHFMREYPKSRHSNGNGGNRAQSSSVAPADRHASR
ncbi:hypothetical protein MTR67_012295 [Solanum verrucosum]|uniref:CCHC-type domain-containing protein n=1 Tax=Solanum verrucosum TaxID=315347 RepID=A0AAF0TMT3_SOLVR|nr:hypothetical protein MTR67_012295 [Solanum verrucosum]